jgi:hypothetical protein
LDLCLLLTPENIERLRLSLKDLHPRHRMTPNKLSFLEIPEDISNINNLYLETDLGVVDLISQVAGVGTVDRVSRNAQSVPLFGRQCRVTSIDDLISAKEAMGRPKDVAMIKELKVIQEKMRNK